MATTKVQSQVRLTRVSQTEKSLKKNLTFQICGGPLAGGGRREFRTDHSRIGDIGSRREGPERVRDAAKVPEDARRPAEETLVPVAGTEQAGG